MRYLLAILCFALLLPVTTSLTATAATTEEVTALVELTAKAMEKNALQTLARINRAEHPYMDKDNAALYIFVFDPDLTLVAHAVKTKLIGLNMRGKPDVKGKKFRDEFLTVTRQSGSGWVDYYFDNPKSKKVEHKTSFVKLVKGSDGKEYIIGCGKYYDD